LMISTDNNIAATVKLIFVIQQLLLPQLIEPAQHIQFIWIRQPAAWGRAHEKTYTPPSIDRTIRRASDLPIGENLMAMLCSGPVKFVFGGTIPI